MEMGVDVLLINLAIVLVKNLFIMVKVMGMVIELGCLVYLVGRILKKSYVIFFFFVIGKINIIILE